MGKLRPHSHITFSYPSSTLIQQYFDFTEILPKDSYIQGWWDAYNDLNGNNGVRAGIYFRDVDFSKDATRQAMYSYVNELVEMPYCGRYPTFNFWLVDFDEFVKEANISALPFETQLDQFLSVDVFYESHREDIVMEDGVMLASRTILAYDNHDYDDIKQTVDALELQEKISANQPVNHGRKDWAFFTWAGTF